MAGLARRDKIAHGPRGAARLADGAGTAGDAAPGDAGARRSAAPAPAKGRRNLGTDEIWHESEYRPGPQPLRQQCRRAQALDPQAKAGTLPGAFPAAGHAGLAGAAAAERRAAAARRAVAAGAAGLARRSAQTRLCPCVRSRWCAGR